MNREQFQKKLLHYRAKIESRPAMVVAPQLAVNSLDERSHNIQAPPSQTENMKIARHATATVQKQIGISPQHKYKHVKVFILMRINDGTSQTYY